MLFQGPSTVGVNAKVPVESNSPLADLTAARTSSSYTDLVSGMPFNLQRAEPSSAFMSMLSSPEAAPQAKIQPLLDSPLGSAISELTARHFNVSLTPGIVISRDSSCLATLQTSMDLLNFVPVAINESNRIQYRVGPDGGAVLRRDADNRTDIDPAFRESNEIKAYSFQATTKQNPDGTLIVRVFDSFGMSSEPVAQATLHLAAGGTMYEPKDIDALKNEIQKAWASGQRKYEAALTEVKNTAAGSSLDYTVGRGPKELSNEDRSLVGALADTLRVGSVRDMKIFYNRDGDEIEKSSSLAVTPKMLESLDHHSIRINGSIQALQLTRDFTGIRLTPDYEDAVFLPTGTEPITYTDRYGNLITSTVTSDLSSSRQATENIRIVPPFAAATEADREFQQIRADLTPLGIEELSGFMERRAVQPIDFQDSRQFFSDLDPAIAIDKYSEAFVQISSGVDSAEEFFGFEPGSQVKNVIVAHAAQENAFFNDANPSTITVHDRLAADFQIRDLSYIGSHETDHLIDAKSGSVLSGWNIKDYYNKMAERYGKGFDNDAAESLHPDESAAGSPQIENFFHFLNESRFIPETNNFGGHANENSKEFFASLVNSLRYAEQDPIGWEDHITGASLEMRQDYYGALQALQKNLALVQEKPEFMHALENAPIKRLVEERLQWFDNTQM